MHVNFKPNEHHTVDATFGFTIKTTVSDPRTPDNIFNGELSLNNYDRLVEYLKVNDHIFAMNTVKSMFA